MSLILVTPRSRRVDDSAAEVYFDSILFDYCWASIVVIIGSRMKARVVFEKEVY